MAGVDKLGTNARMEQFGATDEIRLGASQTSHSTQTMIDEPFITCTCCIVSGNAFASYLCTHLFALPRLAYLTFEEFAVYNRSPMLEDFGIHAEQRSRLWRAPFQILDGDISCGSSAHGRAYPLESPLNRVPVLEGQFPSAIFFTSHQNEGIRPVEHALDLGFCS